MKAVAIVPAFNTPGINKRTKRAYSDATSVFQPEAHKWLAVNGLDGPVIPFDNLRPKPRRMEEVLRKLAAVDGPIDVLACFCHGLKDGLQWIKSLDNIPEVSQAILRLRPAVVLLMTCDAARDLDGDRQDDIRPGTGGDGGFADSLRDHLSSLGLPVTIYAHAVDGHATKNPYVRRFTPGIQAGADFVVSPGSKEWRTWKSRLQDPKDSLRYTYWKDSLPTAE